MIAPNLKLNENIVKELEISSALLLELSNSFFKYIDALFEKPRKNIQQEINTIVHELNEFIAITDSHVKSVVVTQTLIEYMSGDHNNIGTFRKCEQSHKYLTNTYEANKKFKSTLSNIIERCKQLNIKLN